MLGQSDEARKKEEEEENTLIWGIKMENRALQSEIRNIPEVMR